MTVSAIYEEKNINVDFSIFVNVNHSLFSKKHWNKNKTFFFEIHGDTFVENAMILEKNIYIWWSWSSWKLVLGLKTKWLIDRRVLWITNNSRFNNWFKGQSDRKISSFCQIS